MSTSFDAVTPSLVSSSEYSSLVNFLEYWPAILPFLHNQAQKTFGSPLMKLDVYGFTNELFLLYSTPSGDLTVSS